MAHTAGGKVIKAPEPVHGRLSQIQHDGHLLFAGIPSGGHCLQSPVVIHGTLMLPVFMAFYAKMISQQKYAGDVAGSGFDVVRYHSLMVEVSSLPSCYAPIAWAREGTHAVGCQATAPQASIPSLQALVHSRA